MKLITKTAIAALASLSLVSMAQAADAGTDTAKKENKPTFLISKGTSYQQLSYDLKKHGYKLVWGVRADPTFKVKKYDSYQEQILATVSRLNEVVGGNEDNGNLVQGLVCPKKKTVVITLSSYTNSVVDTDGHGCNLLSEPPKEESNFYGYPLSGGNTYQAAGPSNNGGNVGPMIIQR